MALEYVGLVDVELSQWLITIPKYVACNEAHSVLGFALMVLMTVVYPVEVENWSLISHREHLELQL